MLFSALFSYLKRSKNMEEARKCERETAFSLSLLSQGEEGFFSYFSLIARAAHAA
jgi:hypothetical protein